MKIDSPLFDSIRVKPSKDRRLKNDGPVCQWANCKEKATNFAPKGPNSTGRWHYCVKHVREYNQSYNFFSGMDDDAVRAYQKDALTGHRPTWKMGTGKRQAKPDLSALGGSEDPFGLFDGTGKEQKKRVETRTIRNAERKAFEALSLEVSATAVQVKARYKDLVKRHHPDANGGDRSTEDRLIEIIKAYNYLKSVGMG
ncbi:MAG: J domain-containing protein [Pseudolabrys sp.]|nr:J domain-containing protein [Pseudolabrys sp.]